MDLVVPGKPSLKPISDIMEYGSMVLVRREGQDNIELIVEAFKFKELDEIGW